MTNASANGGAGVDLEAAARSTPVRLRLSRAKGFNLQAHSRAVNGLPAVNVARPSKWGNSFQVGVDGDAATCIHLFRTRDLRCFRPDELLTLKGKNLACWCQAGPCHADVLLDVANRPPARLVVSRSLFAASGSAPQP